jgi:hypothetical protein
MVFSRGFSSSLLLLKFTVVYRLALIGNCLDLRVVGEL